MNTRDLIDDLVEIDVEEGIVLVQALGPGPKWYNIKKVEHTVYHDIEGESQVAVLMLEEIG